MVSGPAAESGSPAMALGTLTPSEPQFPHLEALRWPWGNQLPLSLSFLSFFAFLSESKRTGLSA